MLLIKSPNYTPKRRWRIFIRPAKLKKNKLYAHYYKVNHRHKPLITSPNLISGVRYKFKTYLFKFFLKKINNVPVVATDINFKKLPFKEFVWCKSLFNQVYIFLNTELTYPGFKLYTLNYLTINNLSMVNQFIPIYFLPINTVLTFLFNSKNTFITYARSSGCSAIKRKNDKKQKLSYVELPSGSLRLFPLYTYCLLSHARNLYTHLTVQGGWGYFNKPKKVIHVRGVAKNPVDHPNGGRTKAKQPELSPWGWVAKLNK